MWPVLADLGFELRTYGALGAVAFVVAAALALRLAREKGWPQDRMVDLIFWSSLAAMAGGRLLYVLTLPHTVTSWVDVVNPRGLGFVFYGGPLAAVPTLVWLCRRYALPLVDVLDVLGLTAPVAHAISRLGCFAAGCCHGSPTSAPWGVTFTDPLAAAPLGVALHPVQLYEAAGLAALAGALWALRARAARGDLFFGWVGGYAVLRFITEAFRGDASRGFVGPLSTSQGIAVATLVAVVAARGWWVWRR